MQWGGRNKECRMRDESVTAEDGMMLQHPEALCVLPGKLSLDHGTLVVAGFTGSWEER